MNKILIAKKITTLVVSVGTGRIISGIVRNNVTAESAIEQVTISASAFVIGAMVGEKMQSYTDNAIDQIVSNWTDSKAPNPNIAEIPHHD